MSLGNKQVTEPASTTNEAFYTTDAYTDHAIRFLSEHQADGTTKPFFLYLAYTAPHWPLQAFEDEIARYRKKYTQGWDALRESRFQRQLDSGLIKKGTKLSPRTPKSLTGIHSMPTNAMKWISRWPSTPRWWTGWTKISANLSLI